MWPPADRRSDAIRAAAARTIDWPRFLGVVRRHQVVGLVNEGLTRAKVDAPPEIAREISVEAAMLVRENLAQARESLRLQRLFDDADLPVLFLKGASLAVLAFRNLGLRAGKDIDLLISDATLSAATALLLRVGYRRFDPPNISESQLRMLMPLRKDIGFVHQVTGLRIELHWRLFLNPHAMSDASIMAEPRVVLVARSAGLRTLGEEDLFAYLCVHGALHWWNRLKWLADINALLVAATEENIKRLVGAAEARGAGLATAQALLLCRDIFGMPVPQQLLATFNNSATVRWLKATALNAISGGRGEKDPHDIRFGTTRGSLSTLLVSQSWRYRLAEMNLQLTNHTDVLTVPLPERLRFLYPLLRLPLWLRRHVIRRGYSPP
jgi:hypothetical protein